MCSIPVAVVKYLKWLPGQQPESFGEDQMFFAIFQLKNTKNRFSKCEWSANKIKAFHSIQYWVIDQGQLT